ncbi:hypothetical protein FIBSPDRAFT_951682 [Athelia psychrophila]|uniref:Uncharacterized protein n=1 Tax=Athelia psychrophila TaxID=1759441 RepID=A0A166M9K2_9AGAM|nr:hypothetical protein FIBSPDRAFT_951682 [Fibularhizoctonia sp. CBS 109695]
MASSLYLIPHTAGAGALVGLTLTDYLAESATAIDDFDYLPGCYAASLPPIIVGYWITPVIVESVLFLLMAIRIFTWWRAQHAVPSILVLMARDSAVYFTICLSLLIANLLFFEIGSPSLGGLMVT